MKKCKFSKWENNNQICFITDEPCVHSFLFPDPYLCYDKYKIYPSYCYYSDKLDDITPTYNDHGYNALNINGLHITKCKSGFTINHCKKDKQIYSKKDLIKKLSEN